MSADDYVKSLWGVGTFIGGFMGCMLDMGIVFRYLKRTKNHFEKKSREDDNFLVEKVSEYVFLFSRFKQFKNL